MAKKRLKLTRYKAAGAGKKLTYDSARLKSPKVGKAFVLELKNRFQCQLVTDEEETGNVNHDAKSD